VQYVITPLDNGLEVRLTVEHPISEVEPVVGTVPPGQNNTLNKIGDRKYEVRGIGTPGQLVATFTLADAGKQTEVIIENRGGVTGFGPADPVRKFAKSLANALYAKNLVPGSDLSRLLVDLTR
jgi:hypothetical protein